MAPAADAVWASYFPAGGKPRQVVATALMRKLGCRRAGIDDWLFDACYQAAGDLAETIAQVLPGAGQGSAAGPAKWVEQRPLPLRGMSPLEQALRVGAAWDELVGGGWRARVSRFLVQRALAAHAGPWPGAASRARTRTVRWTVRAWRGVGPLARRTLQGA